MSKDEISFDINISKDAISTFFKKYGILLLVLIPVLLSAYIRLIPSTLPMTDQWAASSVENYYKSSIASQVRQQFPNLPDANLNNLINEQYAKYYDQNKATIKAQIEQTSQQYKTSFQDENGYTYMPDIDPYSYLRFTENYVKTGHIGDEVRNGTEWDTHSVAPLGRPATTSPHPIIVAWVHKILKIFNSKITVMQSAAYHPVIFMMLAMIPIFFIGRMFSGNLGGFIAASLAAVNGALLGRTTWGHTDTDVYNILFAVYAMWFFFLALKEHAIKKKAIYAAAGGITIGLFSTLWAGWWYIFDFILGAMGMYIIYLLSFRINWNITKAKEDKEFMSAIYTSILFVITAILSVSLFLAPFQFMQSVDGPLNFLKLKEASKGDLWPNVYTTVAELNAASQSTVISSLGGNGLFLLSLLGICFLLFHKKEEHNSYQPYVAWLILSFITLQLSKYLTVALIATIIYALWKNKGEELYTPYALLLLLWYFGIFAASGKGIRFVMMMVPPFALAIGAAIAVLFKRAVEAMEAMEIKPKITKTIFIIILILVFVPYVRGNMDAVKGDIPIVNDAWYNSLTKIKQESQPTAIVNSWWDFGHHFKYFTDRGVTFDGATQNTPMAHWIGKVLLTSDENEAIGILRMLYCGSNSAFETLNAEVNDTHTSVDILYDIILLSKQEAQAYLAKKGITQETTNNVLKYTHCVPPEDFFITSEDMVAKAGVWAHFGSWDFNKADIWINANSLPKDQAIAYIKKKAGVTDEQANKLYSEMKGLFNENDANNWIASWPGYSQESGCSVKGANIICGGITINNETKDVSVSTNTGIQKPYSIIYKDGTNFVEKKFDKGFDQSILLIQQGSSYSILVTTPELATSMFTRLFFYGGAGLKHFDHFYEEQQVIGQNIIVWKVRW